MFVCQCSLTLDCVLRRSAEAHGDGMRSSKKLEYKNGVEEGPVVDIDVEQFGRTDSECTAFQS